MGGGYTSAVRKRIQLEIIRVFNSIHERGWTSDTVNSVLKNMSPPGRLTISRIKDTNRRG